MNLKRFSGIHFNTMGANHPTEDNTFRRIVVSSTGLGIALMLASLAAVQFGKAKGLQFQWHWSIVMVMALGAFWNWWFWNLLWTPATGETKAPRGKILVAFTLLFALGIGTFLYPMRFVAAEYHLPISRGLITAVLFLGIMFWVIFKVGRGFINADKVESQSVRTNDMTAH